MCRLFGLRSKGNSSLFNKLVAAENAFIEQSRNHSDGWGVAYYLHGIPHVLRAVNAAIDSDVFRRVSAVESSNTVLAHIRKGTVGEIHLGNLHPFQFGRWTFAHNGNIRNFEEIKSQFTKLIDPSFHQFILGETDSELIFFHLLTHIFKLNSHDHRTILPRDLSMACQLACHELLDLIGELCPFEEGPPTENYLSYILSNGDTLLAHQGGKSLYVTEARAQQISNNRSDSPETIAFISDPPKDQSIWKPLAFREILVVDAQMQVSSYSSESSEISKEVS